MHLFQAQPEGCGCDCNGEPLNFLDLPLVVVETPSNSKIIK